MPSSVGRQMPALYLRGSLCNQTMRNLSMEQQELISCIVEQLINDPLLQPTRIEFRNVLRYTIKGDYTDVEAADQEYQVALWRAAVAAKFGWGSHEPCEETLSDDKQRKKFFQTWVFNYMRQILLENKRCFINTTQLVMKPVWEAVQHELIEVFGKTGRTSHHGEECEISIDLYTLPRIKIQNVHEIKEKYSTRGIVFDIEDNFIKITNQHAIGQETIEMKVPTMVNIISTNQNDDDDNKNLDIEAIDYSEFEDPDVISTFTDSLSESAKKVMKIIISPPEDYILRYGEKPIKRYIAEYYGFTTRQIKDIWTELKLNYTSIIGTPDFD